MKIVEHFVLLREVFRSCVPYFSPAKNWIAVLTTLYFGVMKWITIFLLILNLSSSLGLKCFVCEYPNNSDGEAAEGCKNGIGLSTECTGVCKSTVVVEVNNDDKIVSAKRECGTESKPPECTTTGEGVKTETCYCNSNDCNHSQGYQSPTTTAKTTSAGPTEPDCTDPDGVGPGCEKSLAIRVLSPFSLVVPLCVFEFLLHL